MVLNRLIANVKYKTISMKRTGIFLMLLQSKHKSYICIPLYNSKSLYIFKYRSYIYKSCVIKGDMNAEQPK